MLTDFDKEQRRVLSVMNLATSQESLAKDSNIINSYTLPFPLHNIKNILHYEFDGESYLLICIIAKVATIQQYSFGTNSIIKQYPFPAISMRKLRACTTLHSKAINLIVYPEKRFIYLVFASMIYAFNIMENMWIIFYKLPSDITAIVECNSIVDENGYIMGIVLKPGNEKEHPGLYAFRLSTTEKNPIPYMTRIDFTKSKSFGHDEWQIVCKFPLIESLYNVYKYMYKANAMDISKKKSLSTLWSSRWKDLSFYTGTHVFILLFNQLLCCIEMKTGKFEHYDLEDNTLFEHVGVVLFDQNLCNTSNYNMQICILKHVNYNLDYCIVRNFSRTQSSFTFYACNILNTIPFEFKAQKRENTRQRLTNILTYFCRALRISDNQIKQLINVFVKFYSVWC